MAYHCPSICYCILTANIYVTSVLIGLLDLGYQLIPHFILKLIGPYDAKLSNLCEKRKYSVDTVREKIDFESFLLKRERGTNGKCYTCNKEESYKLRYEVKHVSIFLTN